MEPTSDSYDVVVLGAGASGLSLVCHLAASGWLDGRRLAVVDDRRHPARSRQWAFWARDPLLVDLAVRHTYSRVHVHAASRDVVSALPPYRYCVVDGAALERLARRLAPSAVWITAVVESVEPAGHGGVAEGDSRSQADLVRVVTDGGTLHAAWVFDSVSRPSAKAPSALRLAFSGWEVETTSDVFDPDAVTLFDFRTPPGHDARFVYVLPFGRRHGLVELTRFTTAATRQHDSTRTDAGPLHAYVTQVLRCNDFQVIHEEHGSLPLNAGRRPPGVDAVGRVVAIGSAAGMVKASTGYAFGRIQRDCAALADSLRTSGTPARPLGRQRFRWLDGVFLRAVAEDPALLEESFAALVDDDGSGVTALLRFLDEDSSMWQDLRLASRMPVVPFVRSALHRSARHRSEP